MCFVQVKDCKSFFICFESLSRKNYYLAAVPGKDNKPGVKLVRSVHPESDVSCFFFTIQERKTDIFTIDHDPPSPLISMLLLVLDHFVCWKHVQYTNIAFRGSLVTNLCGTVAKNREIYLNSTNILETIVAGETVRFFLWLQFSQLSFIQYDSSIKCLIIAIETSAQSLSYESTQFSFL